MKIVRLPMNPVLLFAVCAYTILFYLGSCSSKLKDKPQVLDAKQVHAEAVPFVPTVSIPQKHDTPKDTVIIKNVPEPIPVKLIGKNVLPPYDTVLKTLFDQQRLLLRVIDTNRARKTAKDSLFALLKEVRAQQTIEASERRTQAAKEDAYYAKSTKAAQFDTANNNLNWQLYIAFGIIIIIQILTSIILSRKSNKFTLS